jgi:hypothetical protein
MVKQFIIASLLIISMGSYAQNKKKAKIAPEKHTALDNTFKKGQLDVNLGLGLFANGYYFTNGYSVRPPLSLSVEKAVTDNLSVGGYLAFVRSVYEHSDYYPYYDPGKNTWTTNYYHDKVAVTYGVFGIRGAFHLAEYIQVENLDLYAGSMLGYAYATFKYTTDNSLGRVNPYVGIHYGGFVASFFIGGRYRFTERIGAFCELGYGLTYSNLGLNLKF